MITLQDYWLDLRAHDWFYMMSEDPGTYHAGERDRARLKSLSKLSPAHSEMYQKFVKSIMFNEGSVPERPRQ